MKKLLIISITVILVCSFFYKVIASISYNDVTYKKLNIENFNSIVDTFILKDGSYFMLVYEREYLTNKGINSYEFNSNYYLLKYNSNNELVFKEILSEELQFDNIISFEDIEHKVILSTKDSIYKYGLNEKNLTKIEIENFDNIEIIEIIPLNDPQRNTLNGYLAVGKGYGYHNLARLPQAMLIRFNENDDLEWINFVDEYDSKINSAIQVNRSEYIVVGEMFKCINAPSVPCNGKVTGFIAKYSFTGQKIWLKEIDIIPYTAVNTQDGNVVIAGKINKHYGFNSNENPSYVGGIMKISHEYGDIIWQSEYFNKKIKALGYVINGIIETNDQELLATGEYVISDYYLYKDNINHLKNNDFKYYNNNATNRPGFLVGLNNKGDLLWESHFRQIIFYNINLLNNGLLLLTGDIYPDNILHDIDDIYHRAELYGVYSVISKDKIDKVKIYNKMDSYFIILASSIPISLGGIFLISKLVKNNRKVIN